VSKKLLLATGLNIVWLAACVTVKPAPPALPTTTSVVSVLPAPTSAPNLLFARNDDVWRAGLDGSLAEQLTVGGLLNWHSGEGNWLMAADYRPPQVSPDGQWVAQSQTGLDLVLIDTTTHAQLVVPGPGAPKAVWSLDSRYLAYVPEQNNHNDLYLYDLETHQSRRLFSADQDQVGLGVVNIVWSPDNRFIALACCFAQRQDQPTGRYSGKIKRIEVLTGAVETIGETSADFWGGAPRLCWTADGQVTQDVPRGVTCSYQPLSTTAFSPDWSLAAVLTPLPPATSLPKSASWTGGSLLTVKQTQTEQVVWQREIREASVNRIAWSPDGAYLLLDDELESSPIWRVRAEGASSVSTIIEDGFLLGLMPGIR